jgi:hypothetical protein
MSRSLTVDHRAACGDEFEARAGGCSTGSDLQSSRQFTETHGPGLRPVKAAAQCLIVLRVTTIGPTEGRIGEPVRAIH